MRGEGGLKRLLYSAHDAFNTRIWALGVACSHPRPNLQLESAASRFAAISAAWNGDLAFVALSLILLGLLLVLNVRQRLQSRRTRERTNIS